MTNLPEGLVYLLIFAAVLLVNYLLKRFGPQPLLPSPQVEPAPEVPQPGQSAVGIAPEPARPDSRFGRAAPRGASPQRAQRRFSRQALLANRREVQNAVVIATILGPCRAFEPHEVR